MRPRLIFFRRFKSNHRNGIICREADTFEYEIREGGAR